jgi:DNA polymerase-3 subunit delta'
MSFKSIINQDRPKDIIRGQLASGRIPHAYLFLGLDGVGRRKTALELAKALNCHSGTAGSPLLDSCDHCLSCQKINNGTHPDVQTIDFAWQARLEDKEIE